MQAGSRYELALPRNVPTGLAGTRLGSRAGASLEFREHRDYQPGDDLRRIDWSAFARSDRLTVKLYREEVNPHLDLLVDGSSSMALADSAKASATVGLAAMLVTAAANAGYSHNVHQTLEACANLPQGNREPHAWQQFEFTATSSPPDAIKRLPPIWRRQGIRIFISDLLFLGDPQGVLEPLTHDAAATHVIQLLAEADANPPQRGNVRLVDCETHEVREVFVDATAQQQYRAALGRHQQNWHRACRGLGATMTTLIAERLLEDWRVQPLVEAEVLALP